MRRIITFFILTSIILSQFSSFIAFAQKKNVSVKDFVVTVPDTVNINEAFDVTVQAVDAGGKKITDYEGTIYFDNANGQASDVVLPTFGDQGYTYVLSDQGEHSFPKAITFKKAGTYKIDIYEIESGENGGDGVTKTVPITVVDKTATPPEKADVTITDPVGNTTVSSKTISVSGTSKANSSINIILNGKKVGTTQTLVDGKFTTTVGDLLSGSNDITAEVLDGKGAVIGTSPKTTIKFGVETPKLTSLKIKEGDEFIAGESITFIGVGDTNLKTVQVKVGDKMAILQEDKNNLGTYSGVLKTSEFEGEFSASISVESQLGTKADIKDMVKFRTVAGKIENIKEETTKDKKARFTFDLTPDLDKIKYFVIKYGTVSKTYTKSVVTYEKSKIQEDGKYTWYIPAIEPGEYFYTITALDDSKKQTSINSGEQTFTMALDAAPTCTIEKISGLTVDKSAGTYSTMHWDEQKEAASYQIYKKDLSGEFTMIDEVSTNSYQIPIDMNASQVTFDDFQVRGICKNGTYVGEGDFSESVKVQTGPELIIFFALFMASGIAFILVRRGYLN